MSTPTLYEVLATKLSAINRDCESATRVEISNLLSQAVYDGARFRVPSFQEAVAVWLRLINRKEKEFCAKISRVLSAGKLQPDEAFFVQATKLIEDYFSEHNFTNRLSVFVEGVTRRAAFYGLQFDAQMHGIDLTAAAYSVGVKNGLCQARANASAELALYKRDNLAQKERLYVDDIDNFCNVRNISPREVNDFITNGYWDVSEDFVQRGLKKILNIPFHKKDWVGEYNDLYTTNLSVNGARMATAFLLKGKGLKSKRLEIADCGKNGDQLVRLFESSASIYVVQFIDEISEAVIKDVEGKVRERRSVEREVWYCAINGQDTARLFRAYGEI